MNIQSSLKQLDTIRCRNRTSFGIVYGTIKLINYIVSEKFWRNLKTSTLLKVPQRKIEVISMKKPNRRLIMATLFALLFTSLVGNVALADVPLEMNKIGEETPTPLQSDWNDTTTLDANGLDKNNPEKTPGPSISVTKAADKTTAMVGEKITYIITVTNDGDVPLDIQTTDTMLGLDNLNEDIHPGDSMTFSQTYRVKIDDAGRTLHNTVTVTGTTSGGDIVSASDYVDVEISDTLTPAISLTKEIVPEPSSFEFGGVIVYRFKVVNTGYTDLTNIRLVDERLGFDEEIIELLKPEQPKTVLGTYEIKPEDAGKPLLNVATVTGIAPDGTIVSATAEVTVEIAGEEPEDPGEGQQSCEIVEIDGDLYFYDADGTLRTDNKWIDGAGETYTVSEVLSGIGSDAPLYFVNSTGRLYRDRFITFGPEIAFYMTSDGSVLRGGIVPRGNELCFTDPTTGVVRRDDSWIDETGKTYTLSEVLSGEGSDLPLYYVNSEGYLYRNRFITLDPDATFYMTSDGSLYRGILSLNSELYFTDPITGVLRKDNKWIDGAGETYIVSEVLSGIGSDAPLYFVNSTGRLYHDRFITFGPEIAFYMTSDGSVHRGILSLSGELYFTDPTTGVLRKDNKWIDGAGKTYIVSEVLSGEGSDAPLYFVNGTGRLYHDRFITFGPEIAFYMTSDGSVLRGGIVPRGNELCFTDPTTGVVRRDDSWIDETGKTYTLSEVLSGEGSDLPLYYVNSEGYLYRNRFITLEQESTFYMGEDGSVKRGVFAIGPNVYLTDEVTGLLLQKDFLINRIVNKKYPHDPLKYRPTDLVEVGNREQYLRKEAAEAFNEMNAAARSDGYPLTGYSGFRSYETQSSIYNRYVNNYGRSSADTFSARPGYSEHQLGLAMDISDGSSGEFENTGQYRWLLKNAHKYGWILRYPKGSEAITGYVFESWHWRYIGVSEATRFYNSDYNTLEEFYSIEGGGYR